MPKILLKLTQTQKELWVAASHDERITLSEWLRRAADARLEGNELPGPAVLEAAHRLLQEVPPRRRCDGGLEAGAVVPAGASGAPGVAKGAAASASIPPPAESAQKAAEILQALAAKPLHSDCKEERKK